MDLRTRLLQGPDLLSQKIDLLQEQALFVYFSREAYRQASFLDDRILTPRIRGAWVKFTELASALDGVGLARPLHFIFHSGHVGSTLLSRLLDDVEGVLGVREPLPLRSLAEAHDVLEAPEALLGPTDFDTLLYGQLVLWSRGYPDTQAVILKTTSTACRLAPKLLQAAPAARAICLNVQLETYLATLLAGENSIFDLRGHGAERMRRLRDNAIEPTKPLHAMSAGELAALAWVVESITQRQATKEFGDRVLQLDFDNLLRDVASALRDTCAHFSLSASPSFPANAGDGPTMRTYAKAQEAPYSSAVRAAQLDRARSDCAGEIVKGQRLAEELARGAPAVAALLHSS